MATVEQLVAGVDFVSIPVRDLDRAVEFYGTTLGLRRSAYLPERQFAEFETGNVTLSLANFESMGMEHHVNRQRAGPPRRGHGGGAVAARGRGRDLRRRYVRHRCVPHGVLLRPGRQCPDAPSPLCAPHARGVNATLRARRPASAPTPPFGADRGRLLNRQPAGQPEGEAGGEGVAAAVVVLGRPGQRGGRPAPLCLAPPAPTSAPSVATISRVCGSRRAAHGPRRRRRR